MRRFLAPLLACGFVALCAADAAAGPVRNWFQSRRGCGPCQVCPQAAPQFAPAGGSRYQFAPASPCGPGGCKLPSGPVPSLVVPQVMPAPGGDNPPIAGAGITTDSGRLRQRVLLALVHHRTVERLQTDGFQVIGGNAAPYTRAKAEALYDQLTDEMVLGAVREASPQAAAALADGGFLARFVEWLAAHQEQILAIVKLVLSLLALFAEDPVSLDDFRQDHPELAGVVGSPA